MSPIKYTLRRSSRRKTLSLKVETATANLIVYAPEKTSITAINKFVNSKKTWIVKTQEKIKNRNKVLPQIDSGCPITIVGKQYILNICEVKKATVTGMFINLPICAKNSELKRIIKELFAFYVTERTGELAKKCGLNYNSVSVGSASSYWGICNSKKDIVYSFGLALVPLKLIDYVIVHELCHTRYFNHGKYFHALLASFMPDYKERKNQLSEYSPCLHFLNK